MLRLNNRLSVFTSVVVLVIINSPTSAGRPPAPDDAVKALEKAVSFFHSDLATHGGYVWKYSGDGELREAEGIPSKDTIWVQPPGTPAVGAAFLDAYEVTKNPACLKAAVDAANALVKGQLHSGGWYYRIEFDPELRKQFTYRDSEQAKKLPARIKTPYPGGWVIWRQRKYKSNMTMMDDDVTPSALRLLMRVDKALKFRDQAIHEAAEYGLASMMTAQYPNGAWSHNYDRFADQPPSPKFYSILKASFPKQWSRTWTKDFTGCYAINDRITPNGIKTLLLAARVYDNKKYLAAAERGGDFLLLAQLPEPQPAWAQQYNEKMIPVWDRKFEPPAITGLESQDVLETLLHLYRETGKKKYLAPVPRALAYLKKSRLPDGKLARFYELKTNRPIYFNKRYQITYDSKNAPQHYAFLVESRLDAIETAYQSLAKKQTNGRPSVTPELQKRVAEILQKMDQRGAWIEDGWVRNQQGRKVYPKSGVIYSQTFVDNVATLCRFISISSDSK